MRLHLLIAFFAFSATLANAQIIIENNGSPADLVSNLTFTNNLEIFNVTFVGDTNQFGYFNAQNSNIPISYGVVLGTGDVTSLIGPNNSPSSTLGGGNNGASDADIEALVSSACNDAAILEFDFISPFDSSITVEFSFGSEEYNNYVCSSYTDGLGIFLSGPGIEGSFSNNAINLATVPGTGSPVSINTINSGVPGINGGNGDNCYAADSMWMENAVYFYNNEIIECPGETQLDGFTVTLSNTVMLVPGETYHVKIVIADALDTALDSAVFLKGNAISGCTDASALNYNPLAVDEDGTCAFAPAVCEEVDAVNFGFEGTCCFSASAFNAPALMGTWRLLPEYGGILVGPEPLNGDWFTGQAVGPQLDDQWTFFANGALIFETNGTVMDPLNGYYESPLNFPLLGYDYEAGAGAFGAGTLTLLNPIGQTCAFMGTWDSGPTYDILELGPDTLRLVSPIMDIPSCEIRLIDPGFFTLTFVRTEFNSDPAGVCLWGCTNQGSPNYEPDAAVDNGTCQFPGCTDESACNFNALANIDDGSCEACVEDFACAGDLDGDAMVSVTDLLILLGAFGNECEPAWSCGDPVNYHGYDYATVQIGDQCWFAENLRTEFFSNGDAISGNLTQEEWQTIGQPDGFTSAMAIYGENGTCYGGNAGFEACNPSLSLESYGRLYSGFAALDERGLCPTGFHVPSDSDFFELEMAIGIPADSLEYQGNRGNSANALKSTSGWFEDLNGTDDFGFNALPGDMRACWGNYQSAGRYARFWTSEIGTYFSDYIMNIWARQIYWNEPGVWRGAVSECAGLSVRCIKDAE